MPAEAGELFSKHAADAIEQLVLDSRRNPPPRESRTPPTSGMRPPIRGILLSDLVSDGMADIAITEKTTSTLIQQIELIGEPSGGTFKLTFQGQTTTAIPFNATPDQVQAALVTLSAIGDNNISVRLGKGTYTAAGQTTGTVEFPGVWIIEFIGKFQTQSTPPALLTATSSLEGINLIVTAQAHWQDTGLVEKINDLVPVGIPTPMRAGAVAVGLWFPGIGYGCIACECREFTPTYY